MSHQESFGMMDQGYFVPRTQIISWLNDLLQLNLTKIQQLGSGAVYCQVIDVIYPGKVAMNKVNWKAKNSYQFVNNLKILQNAFQKLGIKRYVEVQRLSKAKYQDNLQFIQWLKRYFDKNCGGRGADYYPQQRRCGVNPDFGFAAKVVVPKTFNGTGQIISNKSNVVCQQKPKKKEQGLKEIKENTNVKVSTKIATDKKSSQKLDINKIKTESKQNQSHHKKQIQELEMKISMVQQVLKSNDNSQMKIGMIKQILECDYQEQKQENVYQESQSQEEVMI